MSRFYGVGVPIAVEVDEHGQPCRVQREGTVWVAVQVADSWRVDEDWWEGRVWREYFRITTETTVVLVYRNLRDNSWWLQRIQD